MENTSHENPLLLMGQQRGLIISNPISISNHSLRVFYPSIDERELRFALLYWDKLAWPQSSAMEFCTTPDIYFLEECGILIRPEFSFRGSWDLAHLIRQEFLYFFDLCERVSPGSWALAQGNKSLMIESSHFSPGHGILVELHRAIPTPDKEMPLQEILEFKSKRADELANLRQKLDELYVRIANSNDGFFEFGRTAREIDKACADLLSLAKESRFPFKLAGVNITYNPSFKKMALPFSSVMAFAGFAEPLLHVGTALGVGAMTSLKCQLKLSPSRGLILSNKRQNPYNFVVDYHDQFL